MLRKFFPEFVLLAVVATLAVIAIAVYQPAAAPALLLATAPVAYVHQEYPKWVGSKIVHNELEELAELEKLNPQDKRESNEGVGEDSTDGHSTVTLPPEVAPPHQPAARPASAPQQGRKGR